MQWLYQDHRKDLTFPRYSYAYLAASNAAVITIGR